MLSRRLSLGAALSALLCSIQATQVHAQFYDAGCGCTAVQATPVACYQTVPVTTYTRERQTVEVPTYETAYEEREFTVYRPVTTSREVDVPTVSYQNVTEYRTVNRDMGRWITRYHPISKCSPCQVDPRPGVIGWMNRTGYSMRTAFMPNYVTSREYVPSMVACNVPVTRQVAISGTRRVTVQETKMVAERSKERVPVQKLVMKKEEITVMRPQTAYRQVPIGTSMAYGGYYGGTQMAFGYPVIDSTTTAQRPQPDPISAERSAFKSDEESSSDSSGNFKRNSTDDNPIRGSGMEEDLKPLPADDETPSFPNARRSLQPRRVTPTSLQKSEAGSMADSAPTTKSSKASGWHASRRNPGRDIADSSAARPTVSVADTTIEK